MSSEEESPAAVDVSLSWSSRYVPSPQALTTDYDTALLCGG